jgi:hypothetical protein
LSTSLVHPARPSAHGGPDDGSTPAPHHRNDGRNRVLSFDTTHAITGCLVHTEADLDAAGWGHPPLLALLHDQPHPDPDQPTGGERLRRILVDLVPTSPRDLAVHPTGLPGYLHDIAAHLTAGLASGVTGPPAAGHHRIGAAAFVAGLRAARRSSRPGVPVRVLACAVVYEDITTLTTDGPSGADEVGEVRRVDAVDSDGRVYQVTRRRFDPATVVLVDDQPDPADTPATVPGLAALLSATTTPATTSADTTHRAAVAARTTAASVLAARAPVGARLLTADETIAIVTGGAHPESVTGSPALDHVLIDAIRSGLVVACQLADGRISFTRPTT